MYWKTFYRKGSNSFRKRKNEIILSITIIEFLMNENCNPEFKNTPLKTHQQIS